MRRWKIQHLSAYSPSDICLDKLPVAWWKLPHAHACSPARVWVCGAQHLPLLPHHQPPHTLLRGTPVFWDCTTGLGLLSHPVSGTWRALGWAWCQHLLCLVPAQSFLAHTSTPLLLCPKQQQRQTPRGWEQRLPKTPLSRQDPQTPPEEGVPRVSWAKASTWR